MVRMTIQRIKKINLEIVQEIHIFFKNLISEMLGHSKKKIKLTLIVLGVHIESALFSDERSSKKKLDYNVLFTVKVLAQCALTLI